MWLIKQSQLEHLLNVWHTDHALYIPTRFYGEVVLMPYEANALDLDYINFAQPAKEFLFKGREKLFNWSLEAPGLHLEMPQVDTGSQILFGLRACDVHGIAYMDRFYLGEFCDNVYKQNRDRTLLVALNCKDANNRCFCQSVSAGPYVQSGHDLLLTEMGDDYLVEVGSEKGQALLHGVMDLLRPAGESHTALKADLEKVAITKVTNVMKSLTVRRPWQRTLIIPYGKTWRIPASAAAVAPMCVPPAPATMW